MTQRSKVVELYKTVSMSLPDGDYQLGFPMSDMKTIAINQFLHNKILNFIVMTQQGLWFLHLGKDYPKGFDYFRLLLKNAFMKNAQVQDPEKIDQMIKHGEFVVKEIQALYMLKKYRTLKQRYYDTEENVTQKLENVEKHAQ